MKINGPFRWVVLFFVIISQSALAQDDVSKLKRQVVINYADIAHATYEDALMTAHVLQGAVNILIDSPTDLHLANAKEAWKAARVPYQQSEVFRFGNAIVDDWEGQLNAWPLDEGLIDYVDHDDYDHVLGNIGGEANIIANKQLILSSESIDTSNISPKLLARLNEFGGSEANVASGYHAIEFLLWGQDLNGSEAGSGERPVSDYAKGAQCTHKHCKRRADYLTAAVDLLVTDLKYMTQQWSLDGEYRKILSKEIATETLKKMLFGMGSLSLGELAGERMRVALEANSPEDEHDCFSDNTHNSHYYNAKGIQNVYLGEYQRIDGSLLTGPSLSVLTKKVASNLDSHMRDALTKTASALQVMVDKAESPTRPMKFDMMIAEGNTEGKKIIETAILALVKQTSYIEAIAKDLGIVNLNPDTADHSF